MLGAVQDILPNNPTVIILKTIEKWAKIGVGNAEQLYHSGEVTGEERATIKEAVLNLGHTKEAVVKIADIPSETVKVEVVPAIIKYFAPDGVTELQPSL
ncbi:hypothetical protein [Clostridium sp. FP1]|uniref:hypothetical protein n=1 Tax=Clostridium sp. FP1 TaxID=2724076 RepID=UPI0013E938C9|nr:hypothetical protein [Clostridium sp. FP1]MBZ9633219.1 hypothetical protein [Clostridium sp. FP1]